MSTPSNLDFPDPDVMARERAAGQTERQKAQSGLLEYIRRYVVDKIRKAHGDAATSVQLSINECKPPLVPPGFLGEQEEAELVKMMAVPGSVVIPWLQEKLAARSARYRIVAKRWHHGSDCACMDPGSPGCIEGMYISWA